MPKSREDIRRMLAARAQRTGERSARQVAALRSLQRMVLVALLCFSFLQYYLISVMVEVTSMPTLVVFAGPAARGATATR